MLVKPTIKPSDELYLPTAEYDKEIWDFVETQKVLHERALKNNEHEIEYGFYYEFSPFNSEDLYLENVPHFFFDYLYKKHGQDLNSLYTNEIWYSLNGGLPEYGLCDTPDQFIEIWKNKLEEIPYSFFVTFQPVVLEYHEQFRKYGNHVLGEGHFPYNIGDEFFLFHVYMVVDND